MKLLIPKERDHLEQEERARLVNEATTLSTRVDKLRELGETEAKKLQDFQEREFQRFFSEKERRESELAELDKNIERKQAEWAQLLEPLDRQWALYVKTEKDKIQAEQRRQAEQAADLSLKEQEQAIKDEEQAKRANILKKEKTDILSLAEQVVKDKQKAEKASQTTLEEANGLHREAERAAQSAQELEKRAQMTLRDIELRSEALDKREKELEDREIAATIAELKYYSPVKSLSANT